MSSDDNNNPFEEIQKQLRDLLKNPNLGVNVTPFMANEKSGAPEEKKESKKIPNESPEKEDSLKTIREFNLRPKEIRDYLNKYVVKQDEAKKVLSVAICDHYNHIRQCIDTPDLKKQEYAKPNILLLGPTGVGKTYLMRTIAKMIGVPFVKADATKFSETGYVGSDVEDLVRDLVKTADGDMELAEYGIVYIDEIDKIANSGGSNSGKDVSGRGVQINLLKLMEDTDVNLFSPTDMMSQMQAMMDLSRGGKQKKKMINTQHILFIVSGAFDKLAEDVKKRLNLSRIGFSNNDSEEELSDLSKYLQKSETVDFINYGFEPEFVGRLPVRVACEELKPCDLADIMQGSEANVLKQYQSDFNGYDIKFTITPDAIEKIAEKAYLQKTGARGLLTVFERIFRDYKFELPSIGIHQFTVDADTVDCPHNSLKKLIDENTHLLSNVLRKDVDRFCKDFENEHGFHLDFENDAVVWISQQSESMNSTVRSLCLEIFKDFEHGLKIISRNSGSNNFTITKDTLMDPDRELSNWVVESFNNSQEKSPSENA